MFNFFKWFNGGKPKQTGLFDTSEMSAWFEVQNPLRGLTVHRAQDIFDTARMGIYADLQFLYKEIEDIDPILYTCSERRSTTLLSMDWTIRETTAEKMRGYDKNLAAEQAAFLTYAYADAERENLAATLEHLARRRPAARNPDSKRDGQRNYAEIF